MTGEEMEERDRLVAQIEDKMKKAEKAADNWAHRSKEMVCGTCMWYAPKQGSTAGRCRRHSPCQAVIGWPSVYNTDWCGDHKIR